MWPRPNRLCDTLLISAGNAIGPAAIGPFMEQSFVAGFTATALIGVTVCAAALALRAASNHNAFP
jgi:hypothetical protein